MTSGPLAKEVRAKLEKAVAIILKAQRVTGTEKGGWRYSVAHSGGSDMSVTGWQILALRAAKNLGCDVPAETIDKAVDYIKRSQDNSNGGFRYTPTDGVTLPCTATGILALQLCGKQFHRAPEVERARVYLLKNPPRWNASFFYYLVYYYSQATFQLDDEEANTVRGRLFDLLVQHQETNGSWQGGGTDAAYGAHYCTAMAVLALTVEHRFLPIYQRAEKPTDR
jgi:hypothetical protein